MPGYYVENFGCRATQADGAALEQQLETRGLARAASQAQAELVVLNTCTVTAAADQDARAAIRRVQRQNPNAKIVVTGCYAQRAPEEIASLPGVTCVIGNSHKHKLAEIVLSNDFVRRDGSSSHHGGSRNDSASNNDSVLRADFGWRSASALRSSSQDEAALAAEVPLSSTLFPLAALARSQELTTGNRQLNSIFVSDIFAHTELQAAPVFETFTESARTRPNLKVQDGCDNRCSFCVIPSVRGQSRSLRLHEIIREVNTLVDAGYRELVISGINLGRWGRDLSSTHPRSDFDEEQNGQRPSTSDHRLEFLIETILTETELQKLRISSVEPMDWSDELIALVAESPRIAKHAHVPLQSGSDAVLRRMHRKYRPWHYREKIEKIRAAIPTAAIGADVMAGFPGETAAEFETTRRLIEDLPFTYLHVFTYSPRPGTPAADMPNQVPVQLARERNKILRDLAEEKKHSFMRTFIGQTLEAITLGTSNTRKCGADTPVSEVAPTKAPHEETLFTEALTDNYLKLNVEGHHTPNQWLRIQIENLKDGALIGKRLENGF